jgi:hypothetical protein
VPPAGAVGQAVEAEVPPWALTCGGGQGVAAMLTLIGISVMPNTNRRMGQVESFMVALLTLISTCRPTPAARIVPKEYEYGPPHGEAKFPWMAARGRKKSRRMCGAQDFMNVSSLIDLGMNEACTGSFRGLWGCAPAARR